MNKVALVGNPNTGKTSLFNQLTGSYEYIGNWSGVTVERKIGILRNRLGELIDLPGVYGLTPISKDEGVVSDFLWNEAYSSILNIVDASQLERNLHLTVQLREMGKPLLVGLNMIDVAGKRGTVIDCAELSQKLGVDVIQVVARTGQGCQDLLAALSQPVRQPLPLKLDYGAVLEEAIEAVAKQMPMDIQEHHKRSLALQFFEGNHVIRQILATNIEEDALQALLDDTKKLLITSGNSNSIGNHIYRTRQKFIQETLETAFLHNENRDDALTEMIDKVVTNRFLGIPIFLLLMLLIFKLTFDWLGTPASDLLDSFFFWAINGHVLVRVNSYRCKWVYREADPSWHRRWSRWCPRLRTTNFYFIFLYFADRGFRIYGTGSIGHGSTNGENRPEREGFHPDDYRLWLQRSRHHGCSHNRATEGTAIDDHSNTAYVVFSTPCRIQSVRRRIL